MYGASTFRTALTSHAGLIEQDGNQELARIALEVTVCTEFVRLSRTHISISTDDLVSRGAIASPEDVTQLQPMLEQHAPLVRFELQGRFVMIHVCPSVATDSSVHHGIRTALSICHEFTPPSQLDTAQKRPKSDTNNSTGTQFALLLE